LSKRKDHHFEKKRRDHHFEKERRDHHFEKSNSKEAAYVQSKSYQIFSLYRAGTTDMIRLLLQIESIGVCNL